MQRKRGNLKPTAGTARSQRFLRALAPESALLDERTCTDLLSFAPEFARLTSYYDESNQPVANWSGFFERDLAFILAQIVSTDFQGEHFYGAALQSATHEDRPRTREILDEIWRRARRIDTWYRQATEVALRDLEDNPLRLTLESIIQTDLSQYLGKNIENILQALPHGAGAEPGPGYWAERESTFDEVWRRAQVNAPSFKPVAHAKPVDGLLGVLRGMHDANLKLQEVAREYLENMLTQRSDHPPHTALFIAFAKLLDLLRGKINTITGRHLDFYYRKVLGLAERDSSPDTAHLAFELAPQLKGYMLPAGTRLSAGKDPNGSIREYTTDADLLLNRARIDSVKAIYLSRDLLATCTRAPHRVLSIVALPKNECQDGIAEPLREPAAGWPTFGVNETVVDSFDRKPLNAELAFIVASPALLLLEGERSVTLSIRFQGEDSLDTALEAYQGVANEILNNPPSFEILLADAFHVSISSEKGWMPITNVSFQRHPVVGTSLNIAFTLAPSDPPAKPNPALAPEPQQGLWPMLKVALNPLARVFAYSFFKDLAIEAIDVRVSVRGLKKTQLGNEAGLVSPAQPFSIFGPVPVQGSYLLVSHPELAVKNVNHATISLRWFNLPKSPDTLSSYYAAYNLGITDDGFKVRLSVFGADTWIPCAESGVFPLFTRDLGQSGLRPASALAIEIPELPAPANGPEAGQPSAAEPLTASQPPRGTIRVELAKPAVGFGHSVYPRIMADAAMANARLRGKGVQAALPNPPLAPVAQSLELDYEAADRILLSRPPAQEQLARFYCLSGFGYVEHQGRSPKMFPRFSEQGNLYLGVAETGPRESLTLLFHICDAGFSPVPSVRNHQDHPASPVRWRYLSQNQWKDFPDRLVISDSTMGLTRSGIVHFSMPEDITTENTLMPSGLCWIQAAVEDVAGVYWCHVVSITTQAVTATRVCDPQNELLPAVLPASSITQLTEKRPQVKSISQPFATSGGRSKETATEFQTRVSERLRHKGRAIQNFDYERLVLENFPEVGQVKCVGNNNSRYFPGTIPVKPGTLYLVVTPRLEQCPDLEPRLPQFMLKRIETFLRPLTSRFVEDVHVINPVYESLKIFAAVEFADDGNALHYTDDLDAAISQHLQPWRQTPAQPMYIGSGQVQGYQLAQFIQQQAYVKQLHKMAMLHTYRTEEGYVSEWRLLEKRAWASAPWSVLVPAARHGIVAVNGDTQKIDPGIANLTVGSDFVMSGAGGDKKKEKSVEPRYFLVIPRSRVHGAARD